jgi:tetratricopeptide (TPR) repeat protein
MMKNGFLIGLILFSSLYVSGQIDSVLKLPSYLLTMGIPVENTDSIVQLLPHLGGVEKVSALCELSLAFLNVKQQPEIAREFALDARKLSDQIGFNEGIIMANLLLAEIIFRAEHDTVKAIRTLQQAEKLFDVHTHWSLKYRIWFDAGQKFALLQSIDSAIYYYSKPLNELNKDTAWLAHIGAYYWLNQYLKMQNEHEQIRQNHKQNLQLLFDYPQYRSVFGPISFYSKVEYICMDFALYGDYQFAIQTCRRMLDTILAGQASNAVSDMFFAKFIGRMARCYHHWGKYDSAIIFHDSAIRAFDVTLSSHRVKIMSNDGYPGYKEWAINMANQLEEKAGVLIKTGKFKEAETDIYQSLHMRHKEADKLGVAMCYDKLGELNARLGKFSDALNNYDSALYIKDVFLDGFTKKHGQMSASHWVSLTNESIAETLLKIGKLYVERDLFQAGLEFMSKSLQKSRQIGTYKGEAEALCELGDTYLMLQKVDSALVCYQRATMIYEDFKHLPGQGTTHKNMGNYYLAVDDQKSAMLEYRKAQSLFEQSEMLRDLARVHAAQGEIYLRRQQFDHALLKYESALELAGPLEIKKVMLDCHSALAEIYALKNNFNKAYLHTKELMLLKDELFTIETNKQITEIATQYETQQKEQKILLLENEKALVEIKAFRTRTWFFGFIGFMILTLLWVMLYIGQNKIRNEHEKTNLQQRLLRSQMNPHFIFNALSSVQNAILNDQPSVASRYLTRFSKLMRNILDSSTIETIPLEEELNTIENYLALQKIRFNDKFDYEIDIDDTIDTVAVTIPPMLAQPFIENSIEHGFRQKESPGLIQVRISQQANTLKLEVEDDGIGRKKAAELRQKDKKDYKSMATVLTQERIRALNKGKKRKITLDIIDLADKNGEASGTSVRFLIPV